MLTPVGQANGQTIFVVMLTPVDQANLRIDANAERLEELILEAKAIFGPSLNLQESKKIK
jgi:hypothetical protein